jgi:hypothetical protein
MKITLKQLRRTVASVAILALGLIASSKAANAQILQLCAGPVGSWSYTVPQASGAAHGNDTYSADGRFVTADVMGGLFQTAGIGSWSCTGPNTWVLNFSTLIYDPTTGDQIGTLLYRQNAKLGKGGNTFTGSGEFTYYDTTGASVFSGTYTISASRIVAGAALPEHL